MKALIFAAGLGTRLRPLTSDRPKALVEVGGMTLLEWHLRRLEHFGFKDIVINVHYLGSQIEQFVQEYLDAGKGRDVKIAVSEEYDILRETGGGIRHAARLLQDGEPFLVQNVDIVTDLDLAWFYKEACSLLLDKEFDRQPVAVVAVSRRETARHLLFDDDMCLVGWEDARKKEVRSPFDQLRALSGTDNISETLMKRGVHPFAFSGIHVISPQIFELMQKWREKFSIIDFYLDAARENVITGKLIENLRLTDVGTAAHIPVAAELMGDIK